MKTNKNKEIKYVLMPVCNTMDEAQRLYKNLPVEQNLFCEYKILEGELVSCDRTSELFPRYNILIGTDVYLFDEDGVYDTKEEAEEKLEEIDKKNFYKLMEKVKRLNNDFYKFLHTLKDNTEDIL